MELGKEQAIRNIVDSYIKTFAEKIEKRYSKEVNDPNGVINSKKNNMFIAELGSEFMFYSAFVRSFDSSFGKVLQSMANDIALISYEVKGKVTSYLLPQQTQHIDYLLTEYDNHVKPKTENYNNFTWVQPRDITSFVRTHETDNHFFHPETKEHIIIELKAGGDLDNKKARSEKISLLHQYFILKNQLLGTDETVRIFLATAYNMFGEDNEWNQERVKQYFSDDELLIGKKYWDFVCDDADGFNVISDQYKISSRYIIEALDKIKELYFN